MEDRQRPENQATAAGELGVARGEVAGERGGESGRFAKRRCGADLCLDKIVTAAERYGPLRGRIVIVVTQGSGHGLRRVADSLGARIEKRRHAGAVYDPIIVFEAWRVLVVEV